VDLLYSNLPTIFTIQAMKNKSKIAKFFYFPGKISLSFILHFSRLNRIYLFILKKAERLYKKCNVLEVKDCNGTIYYIGDSSLI
jgi:hypothetical protein